ncbi:MerR family transcriptional regulator [Brevibacterium oceani]|uniref:MerR family transcriptional regulator n=1 Tax=Brevibacterium oceani TaxID=358099 RepID=UPI001B32E58D|nr:MerR family transcriptional regulator [Brevibacterium oceani]
MRIGEAAEYLGVSTHLLRHWEGEGVIDPPRTAGGARQYNAQQLGLVTIALRCQKAGMPLPVIARLLNGTRDEKVELVAAQRDEILRQRELLNASAEYLGHVLECTHPLINDCPACSSFASGGR